MTECKDFMAILFFAREYAHREHLKTKSFSEHMALGSFYDEIVDLADSFAESYQGFTGQLIGDIPYYSNEKSGGPVVMLKNLRKLVKESQKNVSMNESSLSNIVDEIISLFDSTIYKLTFLK